ncbi:prokaryotic type I DNA topoisomerase [Nadsonia fulvescens var. elongata DSM 6958]|uniref:DNA topoisomerase n=1 Tax=Nadsonia fulvescens var. elongata DSM 6958 TaxID=857566 RepID=A0A1E3PHR5_9ASCO|nr:prokaryotic type I DNA topoisomerase [Nadsonia fulvescens var. elongata DSM 6958]
MESVAKNILTESRRSQKLMIWTDCDREGENIGLEVMNVARQGNRGLQDTDIKRARFNNTERSHIINAARNPINLNIPMAMSVEARMEIDLRVGAAFTRFQTKLLKSRFPVLGNTDVISYGTCQFPTLSFVVDRYKRVKSFESEPFWTLTITVEKDGIKVNFKWERGNIFDRLAVLVLYEQSLLTRPDNIEIQNMISKPKSKWRPLPLTTVELQKIGSRYFKLSAKRVLDIAEELYTKGFVSYPRTETDQFDKAMNLKKLIEKQFVSTEWGHYANQLIHDDKYREPRRGKNNDNAHPPIHPIAYVARGALPSSDHYNVYKLIAQHFLACCSDDAKGMQTTVTAKWAHQIFYASGLMVVSRNFLDVYPYTKWESSSALPYFERGEIVDLHSTEMKEGSTSAPEYLTEAELISLMDINGIGTDATMADHINTVIERQYVMKVDPTGNLITEHAHSGGFNDNSSNNNNNRTKRNTKGRRKGRDEADGSDSHDGPASVVTD